MSDFDDAFDEAATLDKINGILNQNSNLNFVQRILNPEKYPTLDLHGTGLKGDYGTHLMTGNPHPSGGQMAYPRIIDTGNGLKLLSEKDAYDHALKTGEYIKFPTVQDVNWFGQNYKKIWNQGGK